MVSAARLERGEPAAEAGKLIRRQLGHSFGEFFDLHVAQYSTAGVWLCRGRGLVSLKAHAAQTYDVTADEDMAGLRIELEDITPLIWRRVAVRSSMNLKSLQNVIRAAMCWLDCHPWRFEAYKQRFGMLLPDDPDWNERIKGVAKAKLSVLLNGGLREMSYLYDMGDNWQHRIQRIKDSAKAKLSVLLTRA